MLAQNIELSVYSKIDFIPTYEACNVCTAKLCVKYRICSSQIALGHKYWDYG